MTSSGLQPRQDEAAALRLLRDGQLDLEGRLVDASNTTLRGVLTLDAVSARCVYKPVRGERPLWDFPDGTLAGREVSAYLVSRATGWDLVPPTVLRDGPFGPGSCQLWIDEPDDAEPLVGFVPADALPPRWFPIAAARDDDGTAYALAHADDPRLARLAVLDAVINNADRKGGHVLVGPDDRIYGVDHGVSFHVDDKLRTVLWGWAGRQLPDDAVEMLGVLTGQLAGALGEELAGHLTLGEIAELTARVERLGDTGRFPQPPQEWPAVPWPPM
ncbi:SCO1664 family protein [Micromonospora endolithica]|uniref:SCO1664 family protein n=1 Tax=Micromonospora endolithica TaxID=230091 RepID=A0A3A9ZJZ3_9ACTN|nr:SCO1664 family protein [Micromonospora endolithica]RKN48661.1 SCO1664 family protein [Micromonospora endolithica]TWJ22000.1 putative repeat protein (TIGR03843 family) [Micromonospora endolithica]